MIKNFVDEFLRKDFRNIPDELKIFLSLETNSFKSYKTISRKSFKEFDNKPSEILMFEDQFFLKIVW